MPIKFDLAKLPFFVPPPMAINPNVGDFVPPPTFDVTASEAPGNVLNNPSGPMDIMKTLSLLTLPFQQASATIAAPVRQGQNLLKGEGVNLDQFKSDIQNLTPLSNVVASGIKEGMPSIKSTYAANMPDLRDVVSETGGFVSEFIVPPTGVIAAKGEKIANAMMSPTVSKTIQEGKILDFFVPPPGAITKGSEAITETGAETSFMSRLQEEAGFVGKEGESESLSPLINGETQKLITPEEISKIAYDKTIQSGGVTIDLKGKSPTEGFAFSPYKQFEHSIEKQAFTPEAFGAYVDKNKDVLSNPDHFIGAWFDDKSGKIFLDVSVVKADIEEASKAAKDASQLAIFDLKNFKEIRLDDYKENIVRPAKDVQGGNVPGYQEPPAGSGGKVSQAVSGVQEVAPPTVPPEPPPSASGSSDLPTKERKFITSLKESPAIREEIKADLEGQYTPIKNVETWAKAEALVKTNTSGALHKLATGEMDADYTATAIKLIDKAQKEDRISDAVDIARTAAAKLTQGGQFIQAASMLNRLSPEGTLIFAQREISKAVHPRQAKVLKEKTKAIVSKVQEAGTQAANMVAREARQIRNKSQKLKSSAELVLERLNKAAREKVTDPAKILAKRIQIQKPAGQPDPIKDMINTLHKVAQEVMPPKKKLVPRNQIDLIGQAIREKETYKEVWDEAQKIVRERYKDNPEALDELDAYFHKILKEPFSQNQVKTAVSQGMKSSEIDMDRLVREHYLKVDRTKEELVSKLVKDANIPEEEAVALADKFEARFNELVKTKKKAVLDNMFRDYTKNSKDDTQKILELSNLGALDETSLRPLVAKKLKVPYLSDDLAKRLIAQSEHIQTLPYGYEKHKQTEVLFDMINEAIPPDKRDQVLQILNVPRSIMSSLFDFSFGFRQGAFAAPRFRKEFSEAFKKQFGAFSDEKNFDNIMDEIMKHPDFQLAEEAGISFSELGSKMSLREERFMSPLAEKIPLIGRGIRATARAYTGMANKLRMDVFSSLVKNAEVLGLNPRVDKELAKGIADFVNNATGRGSFGGLERSSQLFNAVFFSPRLMASRMNLLNPVKYVAMDPYVRKEALKSGLAFAGALTTILGTAQLAGLEVGWNPYSADFGKIKIGNTRFDIGAGFLQYIRAFAQLTSGKYVSSTTGREMRLGEGYKPLTRFDIIQRLFESKESPIFSLATALTRQKEFGGKDVSVPKEILERFTPMVINDLIDVAKENPWLLPAAAVGSVFGMGVQTYGPTPEYAKASKTVEENRTRTEEEKQIAVDALSDKEYKIYSSIRKDEEATKVLDMAPKAMKRSMLKLYKSKADRSQEDMQTAVDALSDEEYEVYRAIKTKRGII